MLNRNINYIVSGLERYGTSVMMQMLDKGGVPVAFDDSRLPDEHNPKGYYELAGGKIINKLMDGEFDFSPHKGRIVKITAYGLKFLPDGNYKVIYMKRDLDEVLKSMQKMGAEVDVEKDKLLYQKLNRFSFDLMGKRADVQYIAIQYRDVIETPRDVIVQLSSFLETDIDIDGAVMAVDSSLYRNRADR